MSGALKGTGPGISNLGAVLGIVAIALSSVAVGLNVVALEPSAPAAPLWAVVDASGTLLRGSGANGSTALAGLPGDFLVNFDQNVSACATLGGLEINIPPGFIQSRPAFNDPYGVLVVTYDGTGRLAGEQFHLAVFC